MGGKRGEEFETRRGGGRGEPRPYKGEETAWLLWS
jgi:hypothetical protein